MHVLLWTAACLHAE